MSSNDPRRAEAERTRLAQMLGLLGSDHAGERDAAGLAAHRMIRQRGLTWHDVLTPSLPPPDHERRADHGTDPLRSDWRAMAAACLRFPHLFDQRERKFLSGLQRFRQLSAKQHAILVRLVTRLRAAGCSL
jgi:hypothetical protein